jgi:hypothetical protein
MKSNILDQISLGYLVKMAAPLTFTDKFNQYLRDRDAILHPYKAAYKQEKIEDVVFRPFSKER